MSFSFTVKLDKRLWELSAGIGFLNTLDARLVNLRISILTVRIWLTCKF